MSELHCDNALCVDVDKLVRASKTRRRRGLHGHAGFVFSIVSSSTSPRRSTWRCTQQETSRARTLQVVVDLKLPVDRVARRPQK